MPIKPKKFLSINTRIISGVFDVRVGDSDVVTWNTSEVLQIYENNTELNQLSATSSLGGTISYNITGGDDSSLLMINSNNNLVFLSAKDFENPGDADTNNVYLVTVTATSTAGGMAERTFNIEVLDSTAIWSTSPSQSVIEGDNLDLQLEATSSIDNSDITDFAIVGSIDDSLFTISGGFLNFTGGTSPEYGTPQDADLNNVYEVTIRATKYGEYLDRTFHITVLQFDAVNVEFSVGPLADEFTTDGFRMYNSVPFTEEDYVFDGTDYGILTVSGVGNMTSVATLDISITSGSYINFTDITGLTTDIDYPNNSNRVKLTGAYSALNNALANLIVDLNAIAILVSLDNGYDTMNISITLQHSNHLLESQKLTFSATPTSGTWILGIDDLNNQIFNYNDDASTIQSVLRGDALFTANWGDNVTVTGDYGSGFTITATKYGNLDDVYIYDSLKYDTNIGAYADNVLVAGDWVNTARTLGPPDTQAAEISIPVFSIGTALRLGWTSGFTAFPTNTVVDGIELTTFVGGEIITDNRIEFYDFLSAAQVGDNKASSSNTWGASPTRTYGGSGDNWSISKSSSDWYTFINGGNLALNVLAFNCDAGYNQPAFFDAAHITIYYKDIVVITPTTLTEGYEP